GNMAVGVQALVNQFRQFPVFGGVGAVVIVVLNEKAFGNRFMCGVHLLDVLLGRKTQLFGFEGNGGAVGVVSTDVEAIVTAQFLKANPDVGLDLFHQVSQVKV